MGLAMEAEAVPLAQSLKLIEDNEPSMYVLLSSPCDTHSLPDHLYKHRNSFRRCHELYARAFDDNLLVSSVLTEQLITSSLWEQLASTIALPNTNHSHC